MAITQSYEKFPVNYDVILLIVITVIGFHFLVVFMGESETSDYLSSAVSLVTIAIIASLSFVIAKHVHSWFSTWYGKAYISLGIAFVMYFLGELTYTLYSYVFFIDPYPSIADVFFILLYPFALMHLVFSIHDSDVKITRKHILAMCFTASAFVTCYTAFALNTSVEIDMPFYVGFIAVVLASITLSFLVLGLKIFGDGMFAKIWLMLVIGLLTNALGDVWYYYLEIL